MEIDVALVPSEARVWSRTVCIVIDVLRASSTITTLLDLGCSRLYVTAGLQSARRLARQHDGLLAGERHGYAPPGFDFDNSPAALASADAVRGRVVILSTSNGTKVLSWVAGAPATLVGCLLNARACAEAAVQLAEPMGARVGIVCAGTLGRFALDDGVTAGVFVERLSEALRSRGADVSLTEAAEAAVQLQASYPDLLTPLRDSISGRLVTGLGAGDDVPFCARLDVSTTVPVLRPGTPLTIERLVASGA
ncbi:MAG: 2-phosphosulfolactate phosphatase [Candidatus Limnocylindrales bacterium]|jgi:2-phosphosulfolactate phosphatase